MTINQYFQDQHTQKTSVGRDIIGQSTVLPLCGGEELGVMGSIKDRGVPSGDVVHIFVFRFSTIFSSFLVNIFFFT